MIETADHSRGLQIAVGAKFLKFKALIFVGEVLLLGVGRCREKIFISEIDVDR